MQTKVFRLAIASLILIVAAGCARTADSGAEATVPDTPDGAVYAFAEAIQNNHVESIWRNLIPEPYKSDITEITKAFAEKMDPAVYDRAFAIINKKIDQTGFFDTSPTEYEALESDHSIQSSANPIQAA